MSEEKKFSVWMSVTLDDGSKLDLVRLSPKELNPSMVWQSIHQFFDRAVSLGLVLCPRPKQVADQIYSCRDFRGYVWVAAKPTKRRGGYYFVGDDCPEGGTDKRWMSIDCYNTSAVQFPANAVHATFFWVFVLNN
jgi:hypothetical protein